MNRREFFGRLSKAVGLAAVLPFLPGDKEIGGWTEAEIRLDRIFNPRRVWWSAINDPTNFEPMTYVGPPKTFKD